MRRCAAPGIAPLVLSGKDGLALISANGVSVGHGGAGRRPGGRVAEAADVAAALSMEATGANTRSCSPPWAGPSPSPGRSRPRTSLRAAARREPRCWSGRRPVGAGRAVVPGGAAGARRAARVRHRRSVTRSSAELNAAADNPLVSVSDAGAGQQRQLPPDGAGDRVRRTADRAGARGAAQRAADEPPVGRPSSGEWRAARRPTVTYGLQLRYPAAACSPSSSSSRRPRQPRHAAAGPRRRGPRAPARRSACARPTLRWACSRTSWRSSCCWPVTCSAGGRRQGGPRLWHGRGPPDGRAGDRRRRAPSGRRSPRPAGAIPGPPPGVTIVVGDRAATAGSSAEPPEEIAHVADQEVGYLHGGEVTTAVELGPVHDVVGLTRRSAGSAVRSPVGRPPRRWVRPMSGWAGIVFSLLVSVMVISRSSCPVAPPGTPPYDPGGSAGNPWELAREAES